MARNRESMITQYLNGFDPVPANVEALNAAQRAVITDRCDREWLFQLKVHLRGKALRWIQTLSDATANDRAALRAAFVGKFVDYEPAIVLQQEISKVRLEDDVEKYLDTLLYLGGKLGMGPDALTRYLIDGLPSQEFKQFVMGTDTHNWQNYSQRARLYFATGYNREATPTSSNLVAMAEIGQQLQELKLANSQLVAALGETKERRGRSPFRGKSPHRGRSPFRNRDRSDKSWNSDRRGKSPHRSPYNSYRSYRSYKSPHSSPYRSYSPYNKSRSSSGSRYHRSPERVSFDLCFVCGSTDHKARECPDNYVNKRGNHQEN